MDSVRSLHLSPPLRSTLRTNIVPLVSLCTASLSLEEMREDMRAIGWDKFTVQSVVTVETAAPAMSMPCCFAVPVAEKNGKRKEIEKESASIYQYTEVYVYQQKVQRMLTSTLGKSMIRESWWIILYRQRYYKCREIGCHVKKIIDRDANDSSMLIISYDGEHNHCSP